MAVADPCAWCGEPATHYCTGCGKWICNKPSCIANSAASAVNNLTRRIKKWL